jgi:lipid-binding SYLF domain-containing protein
MLKLTRILMIALATTVAVVGTQSSAMAKAATIRLQIYKAGFLVGVSGGKGVLNYRGHNYELALGGVSLGATIGASKVDLIGTVSNINDPSDIEGTYSAAEAGLAIAGGGKAARLKNSQGVVLEVSGKQMGFMFSVDLSGMQISLKK